VLDVALCGCGETSRYAHGHDAAPPHGKGCAALVAGAIADRSAKPLARIATHFFMLVTSFLASSTSLAPVANAPLTRNGPADGSGPSRSCPERAVTFDNGEAMTRFVLAVLMSAGVAAVFVEPGTSARSTRPTLGMSTAVRSPACPRGTTRARIGGRIRCLRVGQRCNPRFNRTRPSYKRYGFFCTSRASNEPPTLFRIAKPRPAPTTCPAIGPTPTSTPPGLEGTWVGASPFWFDPYLELDPATSVWHYFADMGLKGRDGWSVKVIWLLARTLTEPARISIKSLGSGRPLWITIGGSYTERSTAPRLDPARPSHPDVPAKPYTHEWGSYVVFPQAGCYAVEAQWPGESRRLVFAFGR